MKQSPKDFFANEDDRNDFYLSIPVIVLAALFIFWQWGKSNSSEIQAAAVINEIEEVRSAYTSALSESNETPLSVLIEEERTQKTTPHLSTKSPKIVTKSEAVLSNLPEIAHNTEAVELNSTRSLTDDTKLPSPELNPDQESNSATESESVDHVVVSPPKSEDVKVSENISDPEINLDCSIAIGLYKEDKNLNKMYNRLIQNGYSPIIVPLKYSTKVAIKIPCKKESSLRILQEIRSNYARDAFIE